MELTGGYLVESMLGVGVSTCVTRGKSLITLFLGAFTMKKIPQIL